ncbi:MAG: FAD-dependent oxidoreductase [Rhodospirillales bacterium]
MTISFAPNRKRIAVIGGGISGLSAAWLLDKGHDVTLYESRKRLGGHSHTVDVDGPDGKVPVDTGFIVYNPANYPNLTRLFDLLQVPTRQSEMSFAASLDGGRLEYSGSSILHMMAQPVNALRPRFWAMVGGILRFFSTARNIYSQPGAEKLSLQDWLEREGYAPAFIEDHILPIGAAIWSCSVAEMRNQPALALIRFFDDHGLLELVDRPEWRTVEGGSREYVRRLADPISDCIRSNCGVTAVWRTANGVLVRDVHGRTERFDAVVMASHADRTLGMLQDVSARETSIIGSFRYRPNDVYLHSDPSLMPDRRMVWSSWNFLGGAGREREGAVTATYWMNRLQGLPDSLPLFVTLNPVRPPADHLVHGHYVYDHPVIDLESFAAQSRLAEIQGAGEIWYCGAWTGSGFHEDGIRSGLEVAERLGGIMRPWKHEIAPLGVELEAAAE